MKRFLPHVVAFLVVAIWGTTFVFTKLLLLGGLTAAQIFILRFIIAYILLLSYCLARGIRWLADSWRDELLMVALGVTGGSLYFLTENSAMNYTTTTNTSIIVSLCPLFASAFIGLAAKSLANLWHADGGGRSHCGCHEWAFRIAPLATG